MVDATFALNLVETVGILIGIAIALFQLREFNIKSARAPEMILLEKIRKNTFSYEKILQLNGSTTPITKRRPKNTPLKKRGGGVTHSYVNINPFNKRNPKNDPPRSDSSQKPRPFRSKPKAAIRKTLIPSHPSKKPHDHPTDARKNRHYYHSYPRITAISGNNHKKMVGRAGIEPATAATSRRCHTTRPPAQTRIVHHQPPI